MLPRDTAKETVTVYNYLMLNSQSSDGERSFTYSKMVLQDCIWQVTEDSVNTSQGLKVPEVIRLNIPYDFNYVSVQQGETFEGIDNQWTIQMGPEVVGTYIIRGECEHEFPEQGSDNFVREHIIPFEKKYKPRNAIRLVENFMGSRGLWYLEVYC